MGDGWQATTVLNRARQAVQRLAHIAEDVVNPFALAAVQQLIGGTVLLVTGTAFGERLHPAAIWRWPTCCSIGASIRALAALRRRCRGKGSRSRWPWVQEGRQLRAPPRTASRLPRSWSSGGPT